MQLSIIIVNYNVKYFLEHCLCSVVKACANIEAEIFVVDNNSTDGSRAFFAGRFPSVKFIWKNTNDGFAKANNEAVKVATGYKILFLNPDTIVPEDCFEKCLEFFVAQKSIGALGVKMIDGAGNYLPESKRGFPSFFTSFCKMTGLTQLFPHSKLLANYYLGHLPNDQNNEVDVLSGAFMMVDKKVLDAVGSFDESFFMYAEDIDLSYRIQNAGYKNFYFAGTTIIHFKGESVSKKSKDYIRNFYGTMIQFIQKHYSGFAKYGYIGLLKILIGIKKIFVVKSEVADSSTLPENLFVLCEKQDGYQLPEFVKGKFSRVVITNSINTVPRTSSVLFLQPCFAVKEVIDTMQQNSGRNQFYFYSQTAQSIIGSADKNHPGIAIA